MMGQIELLLHSNLSFSLHHQSHRVLAECPPRVSTECLPSAHQVPAECRQALSELNLDMSQDTRLTLGGHLAYTQWIRSMGTRRAPGGIGCVNEHKHVIICIPLTQSLIGFLISGSSDRQYDFNCFVVADQTSYLGYTNWIISWSYVMLSWGHRLIQITE